MTLPSELIGLSIYDVSKAIYSHPWTFHCKPQPLVVYRTTQLHLKLLYSGVPPSPEIFGFEIVCN